jgi:hypothetical protein
MTIIVLEPRLFRKRFSLHALASLERLSLDT